MSTGRVLARWLALDPAPRHAPARPRPEVPRQRTWQEGRWYDFFHATDAATGSGPRAARRVGGAVTPSTA